MADNPTPEVGKMVLIGTSEEDETPEEKAILEVGDFDADDDTWNVKLADLRWTWIYWDEADEVWVEMS